MKFYQCQNCKNVIYVAHEAACLGENMKELVPNTVDAATEKHVPVVEVKDNVCNVVVGSVLHPQTPEHLIEFILVVTTNGVYRKDLTPNDEPKASFALLPNEKVLEVYEYCNLHGLWKVVL